MEGSKNKTVKYNIDISTLFNTPIIQVNLTAFPVPLTDK